jgi:hypothetical protein
LPAEAELRGKKAKDAAFMLAAVAAKSAALEYRDDTTRNTPLPASYK